MTDRPEDPPAVAAMPSFKLTGRERDLISAIRRGLANKDIANELHISEQTVKNQLTQLYSKLHVKTRLQLLVKAIGPLNLD